MLETSSMKLTTWTITPLFKTQEDCKKTCAIHELEVKKGVSKERNV